MPVRIEPDRSDCLAYAEGHGAPTPRLTLGLINNMGPSGFGGTERQFLSLLEAASPGIDIRLRLYMFSGDQAGMELGRYQSIDALYRSDLDGLLVTGREPATRNLRDEFYWRDLTATVDWAREHTHSTVWSCLAAHAAVLHLDGIGRRRSAQKQFGIFACTPATSHPLGNVPASFKVPHSRWNGLDGGELEARGYTILSCTAEGEVDTFIKQDQSAFVFFQGHPEYETDTLLREYRRDLARYFRGESAACPPAPRNYLSGVTLEALAPLCAAAEYSSGSEVLTGLYSVLERAQVENTWTASAVSFYRGWLQYLLERSREKEQSGVLSSGQQCR
jgi:homoserine O-succinyltransferase